MDQWFNALKLQTTGTNAATPAQVAVVYGVLGVIVTSLIKG